MFPLLVCDIITQKSTLRVKYALYILHIESVFLLFATLLA
ncbi:hypothetical protein HMPREF0083_04959 [Aneurinibacillus aneurinilyticus ATCC 12856]|uniref:Uncharacterized protein n=1 Tax=Aneurinibacillus aneurinilyticus ATCC 12856 TaxID=649747 RepID=U1WW82_ANEAE|nr:hypothetical protein HMPREF0083_04959 [Aneurinibacillus aneurinilyticus ATCC 12856]